MKVLLDEQLSQTIAEILRGRGLDVQAVTEDRDLVGLSDEEILAVAWQAGQAVVTNNIKDFRPLAARRMTTGEGHGGLILLPARKSRTCAAATGLADAVEEIMRLNPDGIAGSERWV